MILHTKQKSFFSEIRQLLVRTGQKAALIFLFAVALSYLLTQSVVENLKKVFQGTIRIAEGDFEHPIQVQSQDEVGYLAASVNWMAEKIRKLLKDTSNRAHLEQELSTAKMVQESFLKDSAYQSEYFKLSSFYKPAGECGGDWWGHFNITPEIDIVIIGDATGHGIPAALITSMAFSTSNLCAELVRNAEVDLSPASILTRLNRLLNRSLEGSLCMTFFAMVLDAENGSITYANGGHVFPS